MNYRKRFLTTEKQCDIVATLKLNIHLKIATIGRLNNGIRLCFNKKDHGNRMLLEEILKSEEIYLSEL